MDQQEQKKIRPFEIIKRLVVTKETATKLKELGREQGDSLFLWKQVTGKSAKKCSGKNHHPSQHTPPWRLVDRASVINNSTANKAPSAAAYTSEEVGRFLPMEVVSGKTAYFYDSVRLKTENSELWVLSYTSARKKVLVSAQGENEAEARAQMVIALHETGLI